jgi:alpha-L-fucosidase
MPWTQCVGVPLRIIDGCTRGDPPLESRNANLRSILFNRLSPFSLPIPPFLIPLTRTPCFGFRFDRSFPSCKPYTHSSRMLVTAKRTLPMFITNPSLPIAASHHRLTTKRKWIHDGRSITTTTTSTTSSPSNQDVIQREQTWNTLPGVCLVEPSSGSRYDELLRWIPSLFCPLTTEDMMIATTLARCIAAYDEFYGHSIGIFIHWGLYSVPAFDDPTSASRRKLKNGSEWYLKRLLTKPTDRFPCNGWQETQQFHQTHYGSNNTLESYFQFQESFHASHWNVHDWLTTCKRAGASYLVVTFKHHDGFCLWPSSTTPHTVASTPARNRRLMTTLRAECRNYGIEFGIYYSWCEFDRSPTKEYWQTTVVPQIDELIEFEPDRFWFDGDWWCTTRVGQEMMTQCCAHIRERLPRIEINDRVGYKAERSNINTLPPESTYRVYADRAIPAERPTVPWEHVNTIGLSWGYNYQQDEEHYKSPQRLIELYRDVLRLGGRLLINLGPAADGSFDPFELNSLLTFGRLLPK